MAPSGGSSGGRPRRAGLRWGVALLAAAMFVVPAASAAHGPTPSAPSVHASVGATTSLAGTTMLERAARSLSQRAGPTAYRGTTCASVPSAAGTCRPGRPADPLTPEGPRSPWTNVTANLTSSPGNLTLYSMTYDAADGYVLLFGGGVTLGPENNNTWTFSGGQWTNISATAGTAPSPRRNAAMTYDSTDGYVLLFGGIYTGPFGNDVGYQDTWSFSGGTWHNLTAAPINATNTPPVRWQAGLGDDPHDGYVVLFGGCEALYCATVGNDTWTFRGGVWTDRSGELATAPSPRGTDSLVWDPALGGLVDYGGGGGATDPTSTWEYKDGAWTELFPATNPGGLGDENLAFDAGEGVLVLFGGQDQSSDIENDTWIFTGGQWIDETENISSAPAARWGMANVGAYDAKDNYDVVFGGYGVGNVELGDTWTYQWALNASFTAGDPGGVDANQTVDLSTRATGGTFAYSYNYTGLPGDCPSLNASSFTCRFTAPGTYTVTANVSDTSGHWVLRRATILVNRSLALTANDSARVIDLGQTVHFNATVLFGSGTRTFTWFGLPTGCGAGNSSELNCTPTSVGPYNVSVRVADSAGGSALFAGLVGSVNSELTVTAGPGSAGPEPWTVNLTANATGGTPAYSYAWTFGDGTGGAGARVQHTYTIEGTLNASVRITDAAGAAVVLVVPVDVAAPFVVDAAANRTMGDAPFNVSFVASVEGAQSPTEVAWSFGDGGTSGGDLGATHTFQATSPTVYPVRISVTDSRNLTRTAMVNITVDPAPRLQLNASPMSFPVGASTVLTAALTGGSGNVSYVWTGLPDGCRSENSSTLRCTPIGSGTYNVTVTATDSVGTARSASVALTVRSSAGALGSDTVWIAAALGAVGVAAVVAIVALRRRRPPPAAP